MQIKRVNNKGRNNVRKQTKSDSRPKGLKGITQSMGKPPGRAFGNSSVPRSCLKALNAFDPGHLALPRAIGDYTTIRTTQIVTATDPVRLFGPLARVATPGSALGAYAGSNILGKTWLNLCSIGTTDVTKAVADNSVSSGKTFSAYDAVGNVAQINESWQSANIVPASFSVQIMNPEALQTTTGVVYIGRSRQMLEPFSNSNDTRTWSELANELVSYSNPRLCAAGKLALRGVQVDAVPMDMNSMADFRQFSGILTQDGTYHSEVAGFDAMAPIYVYNPNGIELQYLICCEWRVRFDPSNPAYASHTFHRAAPERTWEDLQIAASAQGSGVTDIADRSGGRFN